MARTWGITARAAVTVAVAASAVLTGAARGADGVGSSAKPTASAARGTLPLESAAVDALIEKGLAATKTTVAPPATDEEYIRRVYLDVLGTLPTPGSIREFNQAKTRDKRAALVDALLDHPDYSRNWARYWRDVIAFRSPNENPRQLNWPLLVDWLGDQFAQNRPWDKIARELITATGRDDEKGAVVFALAEDAKAPEMAGEVSRIFLGIQIQCAECHDHPSDPWKRQQFHEFAAFFAGVKSRRVEKPEPGQRPIFEVTAKGAPKYTMVDLKDPKKQIPVAPKFFLDGEQLTHAVPAAKRLELAADAIATPKNPWFARAFVNRVWFCLLGEGFYNPIDDLGPTREPDAAEVVDFLAKKWEATGYDIRWLFRTILNTKAYQRAARSTNTAAGRTAFASICPSRLRADQIYDALAHALDLNTSGPAANRPRVAAKVADAVRDRMGDQPKAVQDAAVAKALADRNLGRKVVDDAFGVDPSVPPDAVLGTIPQALFLMNGQMVSRGVKARPESMLGKLLQATPDNRVVLDALYLRVLARKPSAKEVAVCSKYFDTCTNRVEAFEDILWSLVNSTEFISRR